MAQTIYLIVDLLVILALGGLALTTYLQNRHIRLNQTFAWFVASICVWIISNFISNDTHYSTHVALIANYFVFAFAYWAVLFLLGFSVVLTQDKRADLLTRTVGWPLFAFGLFSFSPLIVAGVRLQTPVYAVVFGPLVWLYGIIIIGALTYMLVIIYRTERQADTARSGQLTTVFRSLSVTIPLLLVTEFILPSLTGWFGLTNIGIFSMLIIVFGLYYGVLKHSLFDLKLVAARSTAYVLSLAVILGVFFGITVIATHVAFSNRYINKTTGAGAYAVVAMLIGMMVMPTKRFFDRSTNRLFFRDNYDSEAFLDEFNKLLVSTYELKPLLTKCSELIEANLKPSYCLFALQEAPGKPPVLIGKNAGHIFTTEDTLLARRTTPHMHRKLIVVDQLEEKYLDLQQMLRNNGVSLLVRLTASRAGSEGMGYLILGGKKSGNSYTQQDLRLFEILSNELVIAIQNAMRYEEIENFNETLQQRVEDATRKLRRSNQRLKELDEAKDDFVSMASHQLRTPLTSIKGYTSMVLEGDAGKISPMQKQLLEQSFTSAQRMVYLIADLLNVSRLKTGKFMIEPGRVNLANLVEQELAQLTATAGDRQQTLEFVKPDNFPTLKLDETKTRQVIMNFVDNAIYYTPAGGHITVKLVEAPASVELRVTDTGIGVARSDQPHLFTKFYRAGNARKARPDGTGLGLFMAKKVITAEGGAIIFETQEGKGSTFGFVFPKAGLLIDEATPATKKPLITSKH